MKDGVILIHGLTGTPATLGCLTEAISRAGFQVVTPLLAGHGSSPDELSRVGHKDWRRSVRLAYDSLKDSGIGNIYCAGISLGALLTLDLALDPSSPLKKIGLLGLPLRLSPLLENFLLPLSHIPPIRQLVRMSKKSWEESVEDKVGREIYKGASYDRIPVHSVWELQALRNDILKKIAALRTPAILIHSKLDTVAPPENVRLFCEKTAQAENEIVWLERSRHVITLDLEKGTVAERLVAFFRRP